MSSYKLLKNFISVVLLCFYIVQSSEAQLKVGFYKKSCSCAESIVRDEVSKGFRTNQLLAAGLVRLHFHDCFVRGCDASLLLDSTPFNKAEKDAGPNEGLRPIAFEIIDKAKARLERACPGVVSCADILAFAARDGFALAGGFCYKVLAGRRDGNVSLAAEALANLPPPKFNLTQLTQLFANKTFTREEIVTLSGAHTLGQSHCSEFDYRLYNFSTTSRQDSSLDPKYAAQLKRLCPKDSKNASLVVAMDTTPTQVDVEYYKRVVSNSVLFNSDQALVSSRETKKLVFQYTQNQFLWEIKFAAAMVKMGNIEVLTGKKGTIRANCRKING